MLSPQNNNQQQRAVVPQGTQQTMQFAPWQAISPAGFPQGLAWAQNLQSSALLQGNQIFIRGPQQDQGMFIHSTAPPQAIPPHNRM